MSQPDDLLREAVALARMAQMFRRVGGVMPGVKEMLDSLVSDADAFLAKFDAAKGEVPEGFVMVPVEPSDDMLVVGGEVFFDRARTHGISGSTECDQNSAASVYRAMLAASKGDKP